MGRREVSGQSNSYFVERGRGGRFKKFTSKGKSLAADRLHKSKNHPKTPGHGNQGDYKKRNIFGL